MPAAKSAAGCKLLETNEKPLQSLAGALKLVSDFERSVFLLTLVQVAIVLDARHAQSGHARTVDSTLP